jgi:hypothetical protein
MLLDFDEFENGGIEWEIIFDGLPEFLIVW